MSPADRNASLEERLARLGEPDPQVWERLRLETVDRARMEGPIDVAFERHESPIGTLLLGATREGLVRIGLPAEGEDAVMDEVARRLSPRVLRAPGLGLTLARRQLDEYFEGRRRAFDLTLDWRLTEGFGRAVLVVTAGIPYGRTTSFGAVAAEAGSASAVRAAVLALATNPLPILVPCHRVSRPSGPAGMYRGGRLARAHLLSLEGLTG